jgi:hypothetical protein
MSRKTAAGLTRLTVKEKEAFLRVLESQKVKIVDPEDIFDYLNNFPDLVEPLKKICKKARSLLGPDTRLALARYRDPEINDNYLSLYYRNEKREEGISSIIPKVKRFASEQRRESDGYLLILKDISAATLTDEELRQFNV